ncbi:Exodeoxyribonuclease I [compost metagenome]
MGDRDRRLCEQVRAADPQQLAQEQWPFDDERLPELLFRYRARNFPDTLSASEQERWKLFCQQRLSDARWGAPNTLQDFYEAIGQWALSATNTQRQVLDEWREYADKLRKRLNL